MFFFRKQVQVVLKTEFELEKVYVAFFNNQVSECHYVTVFLHVFNGS